MQGIPLILTRRDIIIHSETGSGKTLAYVLPLLRMLMHTPLASYSTGPSAVIIVPTRELANQILNEFSNYVTSPLSFSFSLMQKPTESLDPVSPPRIPHV